MDLAQEIKKFIDKVEDNGSSSYREINLVSDLREILEKHKRSEIHEQDSKFTN